MREDIEFLIRKHDLQIKTGTSSPRLAAFMENVLVDLMHLHSATQGQREGKRSVTIDVSDDKSIVVGEAKTITFDEKGFAYANVELDPKRTVRKADG